MEIIEVYKNNTRSAAEFLPTCGFDAWFSAAKMYG
jgi:hypothetical protein